MAATAPESKQPGSGLRLRNPLLSTPSTSRSKLTSSSLGKTGSSSLPASSTLLSSTQQRSNLVSSQPSLRSHPPSAPSTHSAGGTRPSLSSSLLTSSPRSHIGTTLRGSTTTKVSSLQSKPTSSSTVKKPLTGTGLLTSQGSTGSTGLSRVTTSSTASRTLSSSTIHTKTQPKPPTSKFLQTTSSLKGSSHVLGTTRTQVGARRSLLGVTSGNTALLKPKSLTTSAAVKSSAKQLSAPESEPDYGPPLMARPVTQKSEGAPLYVLPTERAKVSKEPKFLPPELDASVQAPPLPLVDVVQLKTTLVNGVATSLLCSPDFSDKHNTTRRSLFKLGEKLSHYDPEFLLKVALYTRQDLNIRTTANFLLALGANLHSCRPYLKKYFCTAIRLPSDWIEVAEIYITFHDKAINFGSLPTALRKVMAAKFPQFDSYQLAKYNKDVTKKKKKGKDGGKGGKGKEETKGKPSPVPKPTPPVKAQSSSSGDSSDSESDDSSVIADSDTEGEEELEKLSFTLKQLVRKIHISDPVEHVMCLVGKKYPEDPEAFRRSRLPGTWDQDRAGKRMKLKTPETWETQVSMKGNKASTWEQLIDNNKLPFMAMLRNLRNLILAQISPKHHRWVTSKLNDERAVVNSRQFPFRFFSAYEVLGELEKVAKGEATLTSQKRRLPGKKGAKPKPAKPAPELDIKVLHNYRSALDNALKIATCYNVKPISGSTLILCNVGQNMDRPCTSARGLGKPRTVLEVGVLLGLMCKYSCEHCTMIIYGLNDYTEVQLIEGTILNNMEQVMSAASTHGLTGKDGAIPSAFLHNMLIDHLPVDNIVLLTDSMKLNDQQGTMTMDFLRKYRHLVNPNLLFVSVDLSGRQSGVSSTIKPQHENDIYLAGYSDQILRFIAERGDSGQLTYVENIDKVYNLKEVKVSALDSTHHQQQALPTVSSGRAISSAPQQRWRTVRVFISSTFRDMHGERDLLTRFVFPELRARAHARQIQIYEVDLRWGVTEEAARSHKALEICLTEISRCKYFVGLLGQRYGWAPEEYEHPDSPEYDWLNEYPPGRSITEIEMYHAALCDPEKAVNKAFFYFRDPSILSEIPGKYKSEFVSDASDAEKMENLKSRIRTSGLETYDGYPSKWLGVVEEKVMVGGLEDFGQRVLHNLWNAIQRDYPEDVVDSADVVSQSTALHEAFLESRAGSFVGRRALLTQAQQLVEGQEKGGMLLVTGKPGSGKSAFMAAFAQHHMESDTCPSANLILTHFIGAAPDSTNVASILTRLCHEMKRRFGLGLEVPTDYADLVKDWPEFLEESVANAGKGSKLLILIDGLDLLEDKHNGRAMDWLPDAVPDGVIVTLSAVEGGQCATVIRRRQPSPMEVVIGAMDIWDKAEMVRRTLAKHRKKLDESAFNNQMKLLLTKKEANNPLFLHLACEELRVFGVYEEVTAFLKKLPPTISNLLQETLNRLETEHGKDILCTSLSLLSLVRNGLQESELSSILSCDYFEKNQGSSGGSLPPMVIARLLRSLQCFLQPTSQESSDILTLAHKDIEKAVRVQYMRGVASERENHFHQLLAQYYKSEADPSGDGLYKGNNSRAFSELPFHLLASGNWKELESTLCSIHFVVSKCQLGLAHQLLEDYTPAFTGLPTAKARELAKFLQQPTVQVFRAFVSRNLHVLTSNPALALQQAINEPSASLVAMAAKDILLKNPQPLITWTNKPEHTNPCHMIISSHCGPVTCVSVSQDGKQFATGFKNCMVKLYETATGKEIHSFIGHAARITSICFVGTHALCSASQDNTLSLWDVREGIRIATLKGHTRTVHGCASNPAGKLIASVSWDTSVKVWNGKEGTLLSTLKTQGTHNTPINCVAFHPEGQLIVVGSWDNTLKIWDTFNKKRLKVLKGHRTSVQTCVYAPSGRHVVSAALDGEVKIWSTRSGSAVGTITGHHAPVNSIAFTPNGQYLITAASDNLLKLWSGTLGQQVLTMGSPELGFAHCMSFDPSSQTVRVGYHDGHIRKFNIQTGAELFAVRPHKAPVVSVAQRENFHMSAATDGTIKIWDPDFLSNSIELVGHNADISCAVWDKNGFASASEDLNILIWPYEPRRYAKQAKQASQGQKATVIPVTTIHSLHTAKISSLAFSPDGLKMVSGSHDKSLIIFNVLNWKQIRTLHACHKDWINTCTFSDTSSDILITGSNDFTLKVWDLKTDSEKNTFKGHTSSINSVAISKGCIVSAAFDGSVKVWSHKGVEITTLYCHKQRVNASLIDIPSGLSSGNQWADIVSDEELSDSQKPKIKLEEISVITASDDGTVGVWRPFVPNEITGLVGHSDRVLSVGTTLDNHVVSSSLDGSIRLWSPQALSEGVEVKGTSTQGHTGPVTSTVISPDSSYAITTGRDGYFIVWEIQRGEEEAVLQKLYHVKASDKALSSVCFTNVTKARTATAAVGKDDGTVSVYSFTPTNYPKETTVMAAGSLMGEHPVSKLVLAQDKKNLIAGSWSNRIVTIGSNKKVTSRTDAHKGWVMDLTVVEEENASVVYSIGLDKSLYQWPLPSRQAQSAARQPVSAGNATKFSIQLESTTKGKGEEREEAWMLAVCEVPSMDGSGSKWLAICDSKGRLSLWNKDTKRVEVTRKLHQRAINAMTTVCGNLVTGSDDGTIKVWKLERQTSTLKQIGQFYCQSCVTTLASTPSSQGEMCPLFIVGDSLGHVTLLQWHQ